MRGRPKKIKTPIVDSPVLESVDQDQEKEIPAEKPKKVLTKDEKLIEIAEIVKLIKNEVTVLKLKSSIIEKHEYLERIKFMDDKLRILEKLFI